VKLYRLVWCVVLCWLTPALGQVTVELVQDTSQFLIGESIPLAVRITNRSGQTLRLGDDPDWLIFAIERRDGNSSIIAKISEVPVVGGFDLETSQVATKRIQDLTPHFSLDGSGSYAVSATVRVTAWNREFTGAPKVFQLIHGTKMWEREIGLSGTTGDMPETRHYSLVQANYQRSQLRLYLKVTDASGLKLVRLTLLGNMVSFGRPEPQMDRKNHLHVLFQNGPHSCNYAVCDPDGQIIKQEIYDFAGTRPRLRLDEAGDGYVTGGVIRKPPE